MSDAIGVKNLIDAAWRRKSWVIVSPIVGLLVGIALVWNLPKVYRATTTVLVVSQRLPEAYVKTTVTSGIEERLASLRVQILGPSYLDRVIEKLGLQPPGASQQDIEQARRKLASHIEVPEMSRNASFFEISATDARPERAAEIANLLADLLIEQNGRQRTDQASSTAEQMKVWVEEKKSQLEAIEAKYALYRRTFFGELPEQQGMNLNLISVAQNRVSQISEAIAQRQTRIDALRAQLQTLDSFNSAAGLPPTNDMDPNLRHLQQLEEELRQLRLSYTDQNPDVKKKLAEIEDFKRVIAATPIGAPGEVPKPGAPAGIQAEIVRLQGEISSFERERDGINRQIDSLTSRVRNVPTREQELLEITRDRDLLRTEYQNLRAKYDEASRAEDMESKGQAEHFRVQDRASVPTVPYSPNPPLVIGIGMLAGLALGLGIAFLLEKLDHTVRTEEAFRVAFPDLPLLVAIPNLKTAAATSTRGPGKRKRRKSAAALFLIVGPIVSAIAGLV